MLDKVLRVNSNHAVVYFTHRSPVNLYSDCGKVDELIDIILCPLDSPCSTLSEHIEWKRMCDADTMEIVIEEEVA